MSKYPWYHGYVIGALRRIWRWAPERKKVLDEAKKGSQFLCASCAQYFTRTEIAVDHKAPVVCPSKGFEDWNTYFNRLFVPVSALQVLCKRCHDAKTAAEKKQCIQIKKKRVKKTKCSD